MIYKRVRKNSERKLVVKWRIDYDSGNESQSINITTTIDDENMRYNWKEWYEFKFESSKTESVELDIKELFNNKLSWDIEEIKDVGSAIKYYLDKGDKVVLDSPRRELKEEGTIVKVNRTRAVVNINGKQWNVPFALINKP